MLVSGFTSLITTAAEVGMAIYDTYKSRKDTTVDCSCVVRDDKVFCHCKVNDGKNISAKITLFPQYSITYWGGMSYR
jgi:hypothetical protein